MELFKCKPAATQLFCDETELRKKLEQLKERTAQLNEICSKVDILREKTKNINVRKSTAIIPEVRTIRTEGASRCDTSVMCVQQSSKTTVILRYCFWFLELFWFGFKNC